ncbi:uncharacterized protein K02A2.6-like [Lytechinus pictus]|uniref:uncharacterized protein K02A2.6-like n=1 Tax=Lytechinus pictus TaxID=7653 RepID=UPI0030BA2889
MANVSNFGQLGDEDFDCYIERFELHLVAHGYEVPQATAPGGAQQTPAERALERKVVAVFLNALGADVYKRARDLLAPAKPADQSYHELKAVLRRHYKKTPITVAERRKFIRRDQAQGESTKDYVVQLKHLSLNCEFADKLDEQLRDRFISGIKDEGTALKLMERSAENPNLSFQDAVSFALDREVTLGEAKAMRTGSDGVSVHAVADQRRRAGSMFSGQGNPGQRQGYPGARQGNPGASHLSKRSGTGRQQNQHKDFECFRCGQQGHLAKGCSFRGQCRKCGKKGHIARKCRSKDCEKYKFDVKKDRDSNQKRDVKRSSVKKVGANETQEEYDRYDDRHTGHNEDYDRTTMFKNEVHSVGNSEGNAPPPIIVEVEIEGHKIAMELDTGSGVSIIPYSMYMQYFTHIPLESSVKVFVSISPGETVPRGKIEVEVKYGSFRGSLMLYVVDTEFVLFGRDWLSCIKLDWAAIISQSGRSTSYSSRSTEAVTAVHSLDKILGKHDRLFEQRLGRLTKVKAHITVREDAQPVVTKPFRVPYAMKGAVEKELTRLQENGVLTQVEHSQWSTGIVAVPKKDGSVRICGNYKTTVNPNLEPVPPPNINVEDILANLNGGVLFSKLDLAHAYNQLELDEESKKYLILSTHKGLFQQNRLVFGITSAPSIWQQTIEQVLQGLPGVQVYLDDILVTGRTELEHYENLDKVLTRLEERNLTLRQEKCRFAQESIEFLGHVIDRSGVHKTPDKMKKLEELERPQSVSELRSYLGLLNYYRKFIPNLAHEIAPLTDLLKSERKFVWNIEAERAFLRSKSLLKSSGFLAHFDPTLPMTVATDASPIGIGAVLSQIYASGEERPVMFASRALTKAERNYPQIEREALAIVFALRRFHMYIFSRKFTLVTDNKPLTAIFGPYKSLPALAAERMQRWAMYLAGFDYDIRYRTSQANANADCFSRLPDRKEEPDVQEPENVAICHVDALPMSYEELRNATRKDKTLSRVMRYSLDGWPKRLPEADKDLQGFYGRRFEITIEKGILLWGMRIVVPLKMRSAVLQEVHEGHLGVVKMKAIARSHVWWPGIDAQIEDAAKQCQTCQVVQKQPSPSPLHPWIPATRPMERIHVDFAGPLEGLMFMIVVDAYSKWPEVTIMPNITTEKTIEALRSIFARFGLPQILVSDNGPQFTSAEFTEFMKLNGIVHKRSAPYHPSTNGQAERFVQSVKQALRASKSDAGNVQSRLDRFLLAYRNAAHSVTGESPAALFLNRPLRSRLDNLRPNVTRRFASQLHEQTMQRETHRKTNRLRKFEIGDHVLARDYVGRIRWVPGQIVDREGPLGYKVQVEKGVWRRHVDQLLPRLVKEDGETETPGTEFDLDTEIEKLQSRYNDVGRDPIGIGTREPQTRADLSMLEPSQRMGSMENETNGNQVDFPKPDSFRLRRSDRVRKQPSRLVETM